MNKHGFFKERRSMAYCAKCGKELPAGSSVCPNCAREAGAHSDTETFGVGRISFARLSSIAAKAVKTKIIVDDKTVGELAERQKLTVSLPYGTHSVRLKAPLAPSYKTSVVIDENNHDIRCAFVINKQSGRPEPVAVDVKEQKNGTTYLQPDKPDKKRSWIASVLLSLLLFALMAFADWRSSGVRLNAWTCLLLIEVLIVTPLTIWKATRKAQSRSAAREGTDDSLKEQEEKKMKQEPAAEQPAESTKPSRRPIYETIQKHLQDGELPQDFIIEGADDRQSDIRFAPGALDGMLLYHMTPYTADEETKQQILRALRLVSEEDNAKNISQILGIFEQLQSKTAIVRLHDTIVRVMLDNIQSLSVENLLKFGDYLITYGTSFLAVKLGLTLLSIFVADQIPFVKEVNLTFGAYDEFTWFAARYLSSGACRDGNAALFELARHVHGWGRIHAVNYLRPETREISNWLLYEGAKNTIVPQYSADLCLLKSGAADRLNEEITEAEFAAIGALLEAALEKPGPCRGVSDGDRLLPLYLHAAERFPLNRELIQSIRDWSRETEMDPQIAEMAERLLQTPD